MSAARDHFTPTQRVLHWLMAVCILAMLFIGVGMVSTVTPKYLTLVGIHKPLGIAILVLALLRPRRENGPMLTVALASMEIRRVSSARSASALTTFSRSKMASVCLTLFGGGTWPPG